MARRRSRAKKSNTTKKRSYQPTKVRRLSARATPVRKTQIQLSQPRQGLALFAQRTPERLGLPVRAVIKGREVNKTIVPDYRKSDQQRTRTSCKPRPDSNKQIKSGLGLKRVLTRDYVPWCK